jgi:GT2 family glycosyltransferase
MPKLSVHLVTWNGQKYIEECLNSIYNQLYKDYLLLIIDNGSVDETVKIIENHFVPLLGDRIRFLKNKDNLGFAKAHNQAILWTDSDYILALNQDVILEPDFFRQTVDFLDTHKDAGSLSAKVLKWQFISNEDLKKSKKSVIIDSLGLKLFKNHKVVEVGAGQKDQQKYNKIKEIFGPSAACPVYRRKALEDIRYNDEYFDNDFFSYKEDIDLAYRLKWRAWKSYYLPQAVAYHDRTAQNSKKAKGWKIIKFRKTKTRFVNYHSYKNHLFVLIKNLSPRNFRRYFLHIGFYEFKKFLYILFFEQQTLAALKEFKKRYKNIKAKHKFIMQNRILKDEDIRKWFN